MKSELLYGINIKRQGVSRHKIEERLWCQSRTKKRGGGGGRDLKARDKKRG